MLLAKQELAEKMGANDEKMLSMKLKYEEALKHMEEEIGQRLSQMCIKFDIFPHPFFSFFFDFLPQNQVKLK